MPQVVHPSQTPQATTTAAAINEGERENVIVLCADFCSYSRFVHASGGAAISRTVARIFPISSAENVAGRTWKFFISSSEMPAASHNSKLTPTALKKSPCRAPIRNATVPERLLQLRGSLDRL